jgi:hypothetical protein
MKGHGTKFGRKKEEAIAALLTQRNIEEAAKTIGIAPNTLLKFEAYGGIDLYSRWAASIRRRWSTHMIMGEEVHDYAHVHLAVALHAKRYRAHQAEP